MLIQKNLRANYIFDFSALKFESDNSCHRRIKAKNYWQLELLKVEWSAWMPAALNLINLLKLLDFMKSQKMTFISYTVTHEGHINYYAIIITVKSKQVEKKLRQVHTHKIFAISKAVSNNWKIIDKIIALFPITCYSIIIINFIYYFLSNFLFT